MTQQPKWKFVTNLGDNNPLEYDGCLLFVDETGVYPPELEKISIDNPLATDDDLRYTIYRVVCEPCSFENGILSDNPSHKDYPVWWAQKDNDHKLRHGYDQWSFFDSLAQDIGKTASKFAEEFTSSDPSILGNAYYLLCEDYGWGQFDPYPKNISRKEAELRYKDFDF